MKTLTFAAALVLASTAAHAGQAISLDINGHRIRIEAPKKCIDLRTPARIVLSANDPEC